MCANMGRPTKDPKTHRKGFRLSDDDIEKMKVCVEKGKMTETDIVRKGIQLVYQEVTKK